MTVTSLKTVVRAQGSVAAIRDGSVSPEGYRLEIEEVPVLVGAFRRMVRELAYDVCEMSFTTYILARAHGKAFTALPIFLVRDFHHGAISVMSGGRIGHPKDLEGMRVGVNRGYTVTTGVWARGILSDDYGVNLDAVTWVCSGSEHVAEYQPPGNVVRMRPGGDPMALLAAGELDAVIGIGVAHPDVIPLIPNADQAGFEALRTSGHYPINHVLVVRDEILDRYTDVAQSLVSAFSQAKNQYVDRLRCGGGDAVTPTDARYLRVNAITRADPLPYGIEPNRVMIAKLIQHAVTQRIIDQPPPSVDSLFAVGSANLGT